MNNYKPLNRDKINLANSNVKNALKKLNASDIQVKNY